MGKGQMVHRGWDGWLRAWSSCRRQGGCKALPDAQPRPSERFVSYIAPLGPYLPELLRAWDPCQAPR